MAVSNAQLMSQLWLTGSNSYQQRISSPSVASVAQQVRELWDPANLNFRNEFIDGLMNRVGLSIVRNNSWRNPLGAFKKQRLLNGSSVLEAQAKLLVGRSYDDSRETLLKVHRPEIAQCIHQVNYFQQYPYTVNHAELRRAALTDGELNKFVAAIMQTAETSAQYDEYKSMMQLMSWYDNELGDGTNPGMYRVSVPEPTDEASSKAFLQKIREFAGLLEFPSGKYMAQSPEIQGAGLTTWANPQDLVVFMTPGVKSMIDVMALAGAFNVPLAEIEQRIVLVDEFPMPDVYAVMTTEDFFQVYDEIIENGSFYNPETLNSNYYYTKTAIHSVSPFVPVIAFTNAETTVPTITQTVTNNKVTPAAFVRDYFGNYTSIDASTVLTKEQVTGKTADGHKSPNYDGVYLFAALDGELSDGTTSGVQELDGVTVRPDAYTVKEIAFAASDGSGSVPVKNSRTYIDHLGKLHLQAAAFKTTGGLDVTVTLLPTYWNPSGETPEAQEATYTFKIAPAGNGGGGESPITTATFIFRNTAGEEVARATGVKLFAGTRSKIGITNPGDVKYVVMSNMTGTVPTSVRIETGMGIYTATHVTAPQPEAFSATFDNEARVSTIDAIYDGGSSYATLEF